MPLEGWQAYPVGLQRYRSLTTGKLACATAPSYRATLRLVKKNAPLNFGKGIDDLAYPIGSLSGS